MKLDVEHWKEFRLDEIFRIEPTKGVDSTELIEGNDVTYIGAKHDDNGYMMRCQRDGFEEWISKGNCIVFIQLGAGSVGYANYIPEDFIGMSGKTSCGYIDGIMNAEIGLFLATILCQERPKYSFGRSWTGERLKGTLIKLPVTEDGTPDWQFMEDYIKSLNHKPITTKNARKYSSYELDTDKWKTFQVKDLFDVEYGINMELNTCVLADDEEDAINFVARTEENNGVSAKVKRVEGKVPQEAGIITCAGGGSVLSTFLQEAPFYSGRDLYLLKEKEPISRLAKLFFITVLKANKYRYSYGRQANKTLPYIEVKLPATSTGSPDWAFMEDYMKALPYGDKI
jgi:hypothetical protein